MKTNITKILNEKLVGKYLLQKVAEEQYTPDGIIADVHIDQDYQLIIKYKGIIKNQPYEDQRSFSLDDELVVCDQIASY